MPVKVKFVEKRPYDAGGGYTVPNESMQQLTKMLLGTATKRDRAACICSGGEVPLQVMLPNINGEVIAIDHAYGSLFWAWLKIFLITNFSATEIRDLVSVKASLSIKEGKYVYTPHALGIKFRDFVKEIFNEFPKELQSHANTYFCITNDDQHFITKEAVEAGQANGYIAAYWNKITDEMVSVVRERIDNLTLVHGDLRDLASYGTFDAVYISNAMEHAAHNGQNPRLGEIMPFVAPQGIVLFTGSAYIVPDGATIEAHAKDGQDHMTGGWTYYTAKHTNKEEKAA